MVPLALILGVVFLLALLLWAHACRRILQSEVPDGRILHQDTDRRRAIERPLVSFRYCLTGKPDYLVQAAGGLIPVELKSRGCPPSGPPVSEAAQLTACGVLVEDSLGFRFPGTAVVGWLSTEAYDAEEIIAALSLPSRCRSGPIFHLDQSAS